MEKGNFRLADHDVEARLGRLKPAQAEALARALEILSRTRPGKAEGEGWPFFLLPMAELGFPSPLLVGLAEKLPPGFPLDHRQVYFDFRLDRWLKHLEPPTLSECLEEYLENAATPAEGLAYVTEQWRAFLLRHGAG